jgi:hypothetical protein
MPVALLPPEGTAILAFAGIYAFAGLYELFRWLWYWVGREEFVIRPDRLIARRGIPGLVRSRTFSRDRLTGIQGRRLRYRMIYPSWGRMFIGRGDGELTFEMKGKAVSYGRGLDLSEACTLAELMSAELELPLPKDGS